MSGTARPISNASRNATGAHAHPPAHVASSAIDRPTNPDDPAPLAPPELLGFTATTRHYYPASHIANLPLAVSATWGLSLFSRRALHPRNDLTVSECRCTCSAPEPEPNSRHFLAGHRQSSKQVFPGLRTGNGSTPLPMPSTRFRPVIEWSAFTRLLG